MDLTRLTKGDRVIAVSGIVLFICSFLTWLGLEWKTGVVQFGVTATSTVAKSAWSFPVLTAAVVIGLVMVAIVVMKALGANLPAPGPLSWGQLLLALGSIAFLLVLIKFAVGPAQWQRDGGQPLDISAIKQFCGVACQDFGTTRETGMILGLLAAVGLAVGGYLRNQEDTTSTPTASAPRARATASA